MVQLIILQSRCVWCKACVKKCVHKNNSEVVNPAGCWWPYSWTVAASTSRLGPPAPWFPILGCWLHPPLVLTSLLCELSSLADPWLPQPCLCSLHSPAVPVSSHTWHLPSHPLSPTLQQTSLMGKQRFCLLTYVGAFQWKLPALAHLLVPLLFPVAATLCGCSVVTEWVGLLRVSALAECMTFYFLSAGDRARLIILK